MNGKYNQQQLETQLAWFSDLLKKDAQQIELPDSLLSEHLLSRIDQIAPPDAPRILQFDKRRFALRILPYAASFALVFFGWYHMMSDGGRSSMQAAPAAPAEGPAPTAMIQAERGAGQASTPDAAPMPSAAPAAAPTEEIIALEASPAEDQRAAGDYAEIYASLEKAWNNNTSRAQLFGGGIMKAAPGAAAFSMADGAAVMRNEATGMGGSGVYQTNVQIEGVDEADIVKTDGTYIYQYRFNRSTGGAQIAIVAANGLKLLSSIELKEYTDAQLYVSGDTLAVVQSVPESAARLISRQVQQPVSRYVGEEGGSPSRASSEPEIIIPDYGAGADSYVAMTEAVVYDVSSHQNPKEIYRFAQDGNYVSSRLANGTLYLVTNKQVYAPALTRALPARDLFPVVGEMQKAALLGPSDIVIAPYLESPSYAVVTAINLASRQAQTKAVLGMAEQIMMSADSLFLTASIADEQKGWRGGRDTGISRFSVKGGDMRYISSGRVDGAIDNQFSLDEYEGNLRIATTSVEDGGETVNNLFVLDGQLQQIGAVTGLAKGERIYSVRYRGKTAYVVTFRQVDPLFVIDLSNPQYPKVKGQLKIPGFSEYLHPIDDDTLIGLGMNTAVTKFGGVVQDGMKLSLFDVSDPTDPRETANYLLGNTGSTSEAIYNHKAFLYYPQQKLIGFPAVVYTASGVTAGDPWSGVRNVSFAGYLVFKVEDDGFAMAGSIPSEEASADGLFRHDYNNAIERGLYIGKTLYTVSTGRLCAFSLDTFEKIGELAYPG